MDADQPSRPASPYNLQDRVLTLTGWLTQWVVWSAASGIGLLLCVAPAVVAATLAAPTVSQPVFLAGGVGNQVAPALAGNILAYEDCPAPNSPCSVKILNLRTHESYAVPAVAEPSNFTSAFSSAARLGNNGAVVAWSDSRLLSHAPGGDYSLLDNTDIYAANLVDNTAFPVTSAPNRQEYPSVGGNLIVWTDYRSAKNPSDFKAARVYMYDMGTHKESRVSAVESLQTDAATNGQVVVWEDSRGGEGLPNIYGYDISTHKEFLIAKRGSEPAVSGNIVVWAAAGGMGTGGGIFGYDLKTKMQFTINASPSSQPSISGSAVVWADHRNDSDGIGMHPVDIFGYDLVSRKPFAVMVGGEKAHTAPSVGGSQVVWVDEGIVDGEAEIMGATLNGVATAPVAALQSAPTSRAFEQTGKTVSGRFLDYWQKNGGLAQQGYPISEVMNEVSELDGKTYQVQYFERAVFEMHMENKPPYDVLLSQLGTFRLKQKYAGQTKLPGEYQAGTITGSVSYPSEGIPPMEVYAIPVGGDATRYKSTSTWMNNGSFRLEGLEPGNYYVVAYTSVQDMQQVMAYTKADACRRADPAKQEQCNDASLRALQPIAVAPGGSVENIDVAFFAPENAPARPSSGVLQGTCHTFKETGKSICGAFLQYWMLHGGLAQQGFPLSNAFTETSELDGKSYQVQYFERAVFEMHMENKPPYDVLLSQLGTFRYKGKYPGK